MYSFLLRHMGQRWAYGLTVIWYVLLTALVILSFTIPAAEFRYGDM